MSKTAIPSRKKIIVASLPVAGMSATDACSLLVRAIRASDRTLDPASVVPLPIVSGGEGTLDFIVTHTLGSFLEVEATGAHGEPVVVPIGFAGEDNKLAVIEMGRVASVANAHERGTSFGVGELILDSLDEGAFSVLLGHAEPFAADCGLGLAQALGVKFLDKKGSELDFKDPSTPLARIARIDTSGRSFQLLSSRFFVARCADAPHASEELQTEIDRLAELVQTDVGLVVATAGMSASGVEFGLKAFLGAEVRDGLSLVLEAAGLDTLLATGDVATFLIFADNPGVLAEERLLSLYERLGGAFQKVFLFTEPVSASDKRQTESLPGGANVYSLTDAPLFAPPVAANASADVRRRDVILRLEKMLPTISLGSS